jgi:malonate transporter and related proteins
VLSATLTVLIPVLFVVLLGYVAGRAKAFDTEQIAGINELALDYALPASLFVGVVTIPRTQLMHDLSFVLVVLGALVGVYLAALAVGMLVFRLAARAAALFALGAAFPGTPFFGPAVLGGLVGENSAVVIASTAIVANLLLVPVTIVVLEAAGRTQNSRPRAVRVAVAVGTHSMDPEAPPDGGSDLAAMAPVVRDSILHAVKQPYVWAPVVGLMLVLMGVQVPSLIDAMLNLIGQTTSGVSLFVSGLLLAAYSLKMNGVVTINAILKSAVQPALMLALVGLAGIPNPLARAGVVAVALPSAVIAPMLAGRYGTYQAEAGSTMILTVVLMMVVVPVFMLVPG